MKRPRRLKKARPELGAGDALGLSALVRTYLDALEIKSFSSYTIRTLEHNLYLFLVWCEERAVARVADITRPMILRYQRHLYHYRQKSGKPLGIRAQQHRISCIVGLFRWLTREGYVTSNPATEIDLPKTGRHLPRQILTSSEAERIMNLPDLSEPLGVRDRALLELLYSSGLRRMELVNLGLFDVHIESGIILVRLGKGRRDRYVPLGERAAQWLELYIEDVRPKLAREPDPGNLFITHLGDAMGLNSISSIVHGYVKASGIGKTGSCHLFRHTMATLMLEGGADIRYVQAMLGHENIQSTEIYTHVAITKLREIHAATHPGAKLKRQAEAPTEDDGQLSLFEESSSEESL